MKSTVECLVSRCINVPTVVLMLGLPSDLFAVASMQVIDYHLMVLLKIKYFTRLNSLITSLHFNCLFFRTSAVSIVVVKVVIPIARRLLCGE